MPRRISRNENWEYGGASPPATEPSAPPKSRKRRLATTLVFTTLFFAGASLAAMAGNHISQLGPDGAPAGESTDATATDTTTTDATATDPAPTEPAPVAQPDPTQPAEQAPAPAEPAPPADPAEPAAATADQSASPGATPVDGAPATDETVVAAPVADDEPLNEQAVLAGLAGPSTPQAKTTAPTKKARSAKSHARVIALPKPKPRAPEIEGPESGATIWLNSQLPDPTPPALRLAPRFAKSLRAAAKQSGVSWSLMLAILRARGADGQVPARATTLRKLAGALASKGPTKGEWATVVSYSGDTAFADRVAALSRYDRAVGLGALVKGLEAAKKPLAARILSDPQISIYAGGRDDIVENRVDVRVLALISYLRESFGQVTVSNLIAGHGLYARPGVISAHIYGRAVDISALGDTSIQGHQELGSITERAVRDILLLPSEVAPQQVISLLGLGGPSFALANHYDHIHVGY